MKDSGAQANGSLERPAEFASGEVLSREVVRQWLRACGRGVKIFKGARLVFPERIQIGDHSQIDEGVRIFAGEEVVIGRHVHLAFDSSISGGGRCHLGDFVSVGAGVRMITGTERVDEGGLTNPTVPENLRSVRRGQVGILAHAVIFTSSVILPDVTVGEGAVVSAGSVVHRNLKPWCVYAGNPLVQVGVRDREPILARAKRLMDEGEGCR